MKKHQLLEKAMRDYPAGTVARFKSAPDVDHISDGVFHIFEQYDDDNEELEISVLCGGMNCVYSNGEWAIPVAKSILSGKVAIQVNNEREFKLLMEHYKSKGWRSCLIDICANDYTFSENYNCYDYHDGYRRGNHESTCNADYKIIPFADFAREANIKVPVFVMNDHNGVPLYDGDESWVPQIGMHDKYTGKIENFNVSVHNKNDKSIRFSTKEAADKWIEEQNKPKYNTVSLFTGMEVHVYPGEILIKDADRTVATLMPSEIEDIQQAITQIGGAKPCV